MKSKLKLFFRVGDLVKFSEPCEEDDYGIVVKVKKLTAENKKTFNHYGIFWVVDQEHTFESYKWAHKQLELMARGKNGKSV